MRKEIKIETIEKDLEHLNDDYVPLKDNLSDKIYSSYLDQVQRTNNRSTFFKRIIISSAVFVSCLIIALTIIFIGPLSSRNLKKSFDSGMADAASKVGDSMIDNAPSASVGTRKYRETPSIYKDSTITVNLAVTNVTKVNVAIKIDQVKGLNDINVSSNYDIIKSYLYNESDNLSKNVVDNNIEIKYNEIDHNIYFELEFDNNWLNNNDLMLSFKIGDNNIKVSLF